MPIDKKEIAETIQLAQRIGSSPSPINSIVANCMMKMQSAGVLDNKIAQGFVDARGAMLAAKTPNELCDQLTNKLCTRLGIDKEVHIGLSESYLAILPQGLVELPQRQGMAFQRDVVTHVSSALAMAPNLRGLMREVFAIDEPAVLADIVKDSTELDALTKALLAKDNKKLEAAKDAILKWTASNTTDLVTAGIAYYETFTDVRNAVEQGKTVFESFEPSNAGSYAAAMGAATALAEALHIDGGTVAFMSKATGYINTAAQIQQCIALTAGTGGWGAAIGLLGMANCGSGFGMFGGGGAEQQAVLGAIATLSARMDGQFERVNARLREISNCVNEIYSELQQVNANTVKIYDLLQQVDSKVNLLLLRGDEQSRLLAELITDTANTLYSGPIRILIPDGSLSASTVSSALKWYGLSVPNKVATSALMTGSGLTNTDTAVTTLRNNFSSDASPEEAGAGQGALRYLLENECHLSPLPGPPVHWPSLADAIEAMCSYQELYGKRTFPQLEPKAVREPVRNVQRVLREYEAFLLSIRNDNAPGSQVSDHPLFHPLFSSIATKCDNFETEWGKLFGDSAEFVVSQVTAGVLSFPKMTLVRQAYTDLRNAAGGTKTFRLFSEQELPPLYGVFVPYPANTASDAFWTVVTGVKRILKPGFSVTNTFGGGLYEETALVTVKAYLYPATAVNDAAHKSVHNLVLFEHEYRVELRFDKGSHPCWTQLVPTDPLGYLLGSDGDKGRTSGLEALGPLVQTSLQIDSVRAKAHDVQKQRIAYNAELYWPRVVYDLKDKQKVTGLEAELKAVEQLALVIRAICRLAFEEAYSTSDFFPSLYEGGLDSRLVDSTFFIPWANALAKELADTAYDASSEEDRMARGPTGIVGLNVITRTRIEALKIAVERLLRDAPQGWGLPVEFRLVRNHFETAYADWLTGF